MLKTLYWVVFIRSLPTLLVNHDKSTDVISRRNYQAPIYRFLDPDVVHTLAYSVSISSANYFVYPLFNQFSGYVEFAKLYQFVIPVSYKLDVQNTGTTTGSVAILPHNYTQEAALAAPSFTELDVHTIRGSVSIMPGAVNRGRWMKWPKGTQQFGTTVSLANPAVMIIAAAVSTSPLVGTFTVFLNCKFIRRQPFSDAA
jgi:hypothetical protein